MVSLYLLLQTSLSPTPREISPQEIASGVIRIATGVATAFLIYRFVHRFPWPRPFRLRFAALHVLAAPLASAIWLAMATLLGVLLTQASSDTQANRFAAEFFFVGILMYPIVAGVSYAVESSARAARAEGIAARTQLAALRAQLHPHFLFNALHAVVQLIPIDPQRAAGAAELVADLLRATLEEQRDEVTLRDEWSFVSRYLAVETIRFGERLSIRSDLPENLLGECVPSFALQTLVENAVHHGAAPRVAATEIAVTAAGTASELTLSVRNTGDGEYVETGTAGAGTGLARLRERLMVLYGSAGNLVCQPTSDGGFEAVLTLPRSR